jgi:putative phosphoribosyl transferase
MQKTTEVSIKVNEGKDKIRGNLTIPTGARGVVLFAHGSGSSRFSPRNQFVARELNKVGLATLLIDLLTPEEEEIDVATAEYRFDIELLAKRLMIATEWLTTNPETRTMKIGYFGASTGAAAALIAATEHTKQINAIVSRGGRPDLAIEYVPKVQAPTLFIVGGDDSVVIELNKKAMKNFPAKSKLEIVPGATHLFEEEGKLEIVSKLAAKWLSTYLI